ncbi:dihydroorotase [Boudabousia marimammalium]|uniref:Dihydroorotase n=1 Tax=Boudabousia marimammalium TaxID=156892 RepID=A0A1Q5PSV7_9ACTO|nr:dihydroorotase [Boudabousia marimammalium]
MLITNARTLGAGTSDSLEATQILVADGKVKAIVTGRADAPQQTDARVIDVQGALVTPGLVDIHVHLREPGETHKETIATGTAAAARGGWTTVCAMPNTVPDPHTPQLLAQVQELIREHAVINVHAYSPITRGLTSDDVVDIIAQAEAGAVGFSNDGKGVQKAGTMWRAMQLAAQVNRPVATHAEDESIKGEGVINEGEASARLDLPGIHRLAETVQVARDALIAEATGAHYHLCHASTVESMRILRRAQADGVNMSAEATPHHLLLTDADIPADDANWKVNPPLRSQLDAAAVLEGLNDGTISAIATDNAPHTDPEKHCSFRTGAFGLVTNEHSFALLYTHLVRTGKLSLRRLVELLTTGPADLYHLDAGRLSVGVPADLAAYALDSQSLIDPAAFVGMGHNNPFVNTPVQGDCVLTLCGGRVVNWQPTLGPQN